MKIYGNYYTKTKTLPKCLFWGKLSVRMYYCLLLLEIYLFVLLVNCCTVARLQVTWWRLGAVVGDTIGHAGYECPSSHEMFSGVTPAIVPNRLLCVRHFLIFQFLIAILLILCRKCRLAHFCHKWQVKKRFRF